MEYQNDGAEGRRVIARHNIRITGSGEKVLLFAHGFGCDQQVWNSVWPGFAETHKIVLFDYIGAGGAEAGAYSAARYNDLQGYAGDVLDICRALNLQQVIFVGHSVSSMIGLLAAVRSPEIFSKLIFIGPSPRYMNDEGYPGGMERDDLEALLEVMESNFISWSGTVAPAIMGNADRPELGAALTESFCRTNPEIAKQFARVTFLSDNRKDLPLLKVPSLTIQCNDDFLTSVKVARYVQEHTPGNELVLLETEGHCPHQSDPEGVIGAIRAYIEQV